MRVDEKKPGQLLTARLPGDKHIQIRHVLAVKRRTALTRVVAHIHDRKNAVEIWELPSSLAVK